MLAYSFSFDDTIFQAVMIVVKAVVCFKGFYLCIKSTQKTNIKAVKLQNGSYNEKQSCCCPGKMINQ